MEKLIKKNKSRAVVVLILSLLALTWQFINYMVVTSILKEYTEIGTFEVYMLYSSYIIFILQFISILILIYSVFRVSMRYSSLQKKEAKNNSQLDSNQVKPII